MTSPIEGVESGTVIWRVLNAEQDTNDPDRQPNFGTFRGTVLFTASRNTVRRLLPAPAYTIFLDAVQGEVGDDGILRDLSGEEGVVLVSPYATGIEETGWTWEASFALNQRSKVSFSFQFQPDEVVDLSWVTPVVSTPGVVMTKGETGTAATVAVGTVDTLAAGAQATVDNSGTSSAAILDFGLPRGDTGDTGPSGTITGATAVGLAEGAIPTVTPGGTPEARTFEFGIPVGATGDPGPTGPSGTITGATAVGLAEGAAPTVTPGGTPEARTFEFGIPVGATGLTGDPGPGYTSRGPWTDATAYALRDIVTNDGSTFEAVVAHTSAANPPTTAAPTVNWLLWAAKGDQGPAGAGAPDATTTSKGSVQLAGDLSGTADLPTVPGLAGKSDTGHSHIDTDISNSTATGRSVLTAVDAPTARAAIGAGTSDLVIGTTSATAKAGDYEPPAASTTAVGVVRIATAVESTTGTATDLAVPPAGLKVVADTKVTAYDTTLTTIRQMTQAAFDALGTWDSATLYVIVG